MKLTVNVPATTANLGPGFDCLGLALHWWNTITLQACEQTDVRVRGLKEGIPADTTNTTIQAMAHMFKCLQLEFPCVRVTMTNRIPIGRGLGSSAAAIVGGLVAANAWAGRRNSGSNTLVAMTWHRLRKALQSSNVEMLVG